MGFIDSYKHLEKLCGEIFDCERKISAYIDEMKETPQGAFVVKHWDDDLKKLIHYRSIRNKIVHELNCTEENMCEPDDAIWLDDFYSRIMNQTDPLSLYNKANKESKTQDTNAVKKPQTNQYPHTQTEYVPHKKITKEPVGCSVLLLICILVISIAIITHL